MITDRHVPVTLEQATLHCEACGTLLAVIESLGNTICTVYLWRPVKDLEGNDMLSRCHGKGVSDWQAVSAYRNDRCDQYWQDTITTYHWPDREPVLAPETEEPVLPDQHEQMILLEKE